MHHGGGEGSGQFASWYARDHWKEIDHLAYLNPDDSEYDGYWEELGWDVPAPNSGNNYSSLDDHIEFSLPVERVFLLRRITSSRYAQQERRCPQRGDPRRPKL